MIAPNLFHPFSKTHNLFHKSLYSMNYCSTYGIAAVVVLFSAIAIATAPVCFPENPFDRYLSACLYRAVY